jgi:hypothetical protein
VKFARFKSKDRWIEIKVIAARRRIKAYINPTYKTKHLRKQRSKPQVSEMFYSVLMDLWTDIVYPKSSGLVWITQVTERYTKN